MHGIVILTSCYSSNRPDKLEWLKKLPPNIQYVIIRGNTNLTTDYVFQPETHECVLRCSDTYEGLPDKIRAGFRFVHKEFNPDFVIKVDDDVVVDVPKLLEFIESNTGDYVGVATYYRGYVYCGGPLYYLSSLALGYMKDMDITGFTEEDICIGRCASKNNIPIRNYKLHNHDYEKRHECIGYHDHSRVLFPQPVLPAPAPASRPLNRPKFLYSTRFNLR